MTFNCSSRRIFHALCLSTAPDGHLTIHRFLNCRIWAGMGSGVVDAGTGLNCTKGTKVDLLNGIVFHPTNGLRWVGSMGWVWVCCPGNRDRILPALVKKGSKESANTS